MFRAAPARPKRVVAGPKRLSPRLRGYDAAWDRRSARYRRAHPFCENPVHGDRVVFAEVVDHKHPVQDGGAVHCADAGLWSLCSACHAWKGEIEAYARREDQVDQIVRWCDEPSSRPLVRRGDVRAT